MVVTVTVEVSSRPDVKIFLGRALRSWIPNVSTSSSVSPISESSENDPIFIAFTKPHGLLGSFRETRYQPGERPHLPRETFHCLHPDCGTSSGPIFGRAKCQARTRQPRALLRMVIPARFSVRRFRRSSPRWCLVTGGPWEAAGLGPGQRGASVISLRHHLPSSKVPWYPSSR